MYMFYGIKFYCINVIKNNILTLYQVSRPLGHNILLHSKTGFVLPKTPCFHSLGVTVTIIILVRIV